MLQLTATSDAVDQDYGRAYRIDGGAERGQSRGRKGRGGRGQRDNERSLTHHGDLLTNRKNGVSL